MDLFSFIPSLCFLGYIIFNLNFNFELSQVLIYGILIINSLVFLYAVNLIIASISFWTVQSYGIGRIIDNIFKIGRYPLDIFEGLWKVVFVYFFPLIVIAQIPVQVFLKILSFKFIIFAFFVSVFFMSISLILWKRGIKNYLSASS